MQMEQSHYSKVSGFGPDFVQVHRFLQRIYEPVPNGNWLWNRWQWMHLLPYLDETMLDRIGV